MDKDKTFAQMLHINEKLGELEVFPSLGWTVAFDIMKDIFDNSQYKDLAVNDYVDEAIPDGVTLKQIFDKFCDDIDSLGISLDLGFEILEEIIRDWMRENGFLVALDDDGWLE